MIDSLITGASTAESEAVWRIRMLRCYTE